MKSFHLIVPLLLLASCTSFEDFQAMSPEERADRVCSATSSARERNRYLSGLNGEINEKENLLARGYRVYESCQLMNVAVPVQATDCSKLSGADLQNCQRGNAASRIETRRVCREVPVGIDYAYEARALSDLRTLRDSELDNQALESEVCIEKAKSLSAKDAYLLYRNNAEP